MTFGRADVRISKSIVDNYDDNDNGDDGDSDKDISEQAPGTFEQATKIPLPSYYKGLTSEVETETETN